MGGNALSKFGVNTVRLDRDGYEKVFNIVYDRLYEHTLAMTDVPYVSNKDSFGDIDILYCTSNNQKLIPQFIKAMFPEHNAMYVNGDVISFDVENFQVDLIYSPTYEYSYALNYFSYNDIFGNLVGKLFHKIGLKHGHNGLYLPIRNDHTIIANILITRDFLKAIQFIDLDPSVILPGFASIEEGFEWVSKSKFFDPDSYKLENLNHVAKVRDRKRTTYNKFLAWCREWETSNTKKIEFNKDKSVYLPMIFEAFPNAKSEYEYAVARHIFCQHMGTRFNGKMVSEKTGFTGPKLGQFMQFLRKDKFFDLYTLGMAKDSTIWDCVENHRKTFIEEL